MIKSITVDTLTAIQSNEFMTDRNKPGHDAWKDYGQAIYEFMLAIQDRKFELVLILGEPGTGKSSGMRTLPHNSNIWFNADNKNPVWTGGITEYGKKGNPRFPYHVIPRSYDAILSHIDVAITDGAIGEDDRYAFILGHTEVYKKGNDNMERLKTLGKLATKMQLEGKMETVMYSKVEMSKGVPAFILETQNDGFNTARSPQGLFEGKISNDFNMIIEKLSGNLLA